MVQRNPSDGELWGALGSTGLGMLPNISLWNTKVFFFLGSMGEHFENKE
jgi:hypothetical protein